MLKTIKRYWYQFLQHQDYLLGVWSCKAMQLRGFSPNPIHPKHLFDEKRSDFLHGLFQKEICFLDIGSGVGTDCLLASEKRALLSVGLEGNRNSIETALQRSKKQTLKTVFIQIDLEQGHLPFKDNSFDLINFSNVLEHLHNRRGILNEIKRIKKQGALVVISVPNSETSWKKKLVSAGLDSMDDPDHKIEYSKESLFLEMEGAELNISSELMPIIPSFPWNGIIAMSAAFSPKLYKRLQKEKRKYVKANPDESLGWFFTVK